VSVGVVTVRVFPELSWSWCIGGAGELRIALTWNPDWSSSIGSGPVSEAVETEPTPKTCPKRDDLVVVFEHLVTEKEAEGTIHVWSSVSIRQRCDRGDTPQYVSGIPSMSDTRTVG